MEIEAKITELATKIEQLDILLKEKTKENENLKSRIGDLIYENIKLKSKISENSLKEARTDQEDIEYGQRLARTVSGSIRSDE